MATYEDTAFWKVTCDILDEFDPADWVKEDVDDWSVCGRPLTPRVPDWTDPKSIWRAYHSAPNDPLWGKFACLLNVPVS